MLTQSRWKTLLGFAVGLIVLIGFVQIGFVFLFAPSMPISGNMQSSTSKFGAFAISYPEEWTFRETPKGYNGDSSIVAFLAYPNILKLGVFAFIRHSTGGFNSVTDISKWGEQIAQQKQGYREISIERIQSKGEEMLLREYSWLTPATPLQGSQLIRCLDNYRLHIRDAFILSLCVNEEDFAKNKSIFLQVVESFAYQY